MTRGVVMISGRCEDALAMIPGVPDVRACMSSEEWAWILLILRDLDDRPEWFPAGKSATIQAIESQVAEDVRAIVAAANATAWEPDR